MSDNATARLDSAVFKQLKEEGYAVIPDVVTPQVCDELISLFRPWLAEFGEGERYCKDNWIVHDYHIGHFEPLWRARLMVKDVFASLWGTDKLFTSFDGCSIAPPSEAGCVPFRKPDDCWFHTDQGVRRRGLHAYQGALYLEETTREDYCFRVLARSHLFHSEIIALPETRQKWREDYNKLTEEQIAWYKERGCQETLVPVPRGGMVLWDSRTIHDSVKPQQGRAASDRWRFTLFICMVPAAWAFSDVIPQRRQLYDRMETTGHWAAQEINLFPVTSASKHNLPRLPEVARSREARLLAGVNPYDFQDSKPNGPEKPQWVTWE